MSQITMYDPHAPEHAHGIYVSELLKALREVEPEITVNLLGTREWGTAQAVSALHCRLYPALPVPRARAEYANVIAWVFARLVRPAALEWQIIRHIVKHPEIAAVHYQLAQSLCTVLSRCVFLRVGTRRLLTVHNIEPHDPGLGCFRSARTIVNRAVLRSFDGLIVHSAKLRADLAGYLGRHSPPVFVACQGTGRPDVDNSPSLETRLRERAILFLGAARPNKGLHVLLNAMAELPDFTLTVAGYRGHDRYRKRIVAPLLEIARNNRSQVSVLSGFVPEDRVRQLLRNHSLVALPYTHFRSDSAALHLAIAYGVPVVVTDVGALAETVTSFGIGVVVPPNDPIAFADGIRRLYTLATADIDRGLRKAQQALSWSQAALQTAGIYKAVLSCR